MRSIGKLGASMAFRPFFLLLGVHAVLIIGFWGAYLAGILEWPANLSPRVRHGHEMLFGFGGAAVAGFVLTAVATWTRRAPVAGRPLLILAGLWSTARLVAFLPGGIGLGLWGAASLGFWLGVTALLARELWAAADRRNYKVLLLLGVFPLAEATCFTGIGAGNEALAETALRAALMGLLGLIVLVGGRIIPAFTRNWLDRNRPEFAPGVPGFAGFDLASVLVLAVFAVGFTLWPEAPTTGWVGLSAAFLQLVRVSRWRGWRVVREPMLWVLHLGYAWLPAGLALLGLAALGRGLGFDAGLHALAYGAIGTMILGVAARVARGHSGRPLRAGRVLTAAILLVTVGAVVRVLTPAGADLNTAVWLWIGAYALFLIDTVPILLAPVPEA